MRKNLSVSSVEIQTLGFNPARLVKLEKCYKDIIPEMEGIACETD